MERSPGETRSNMPGGKPDMLGRLAFLFLLIPVLELYLLIQAGIWVGNGWIIVALVILTGVVGAAAARLQGLSVIHRMRQSLAAGEVPEEGVIDGIFIFLGGMLLIMPGFITDVAGIGLLLPIIRRWLKTWLRRKFTHWIERGTIHFYIR